MIGAWCVAQASPAWLEGSVEVPFWIPGALLGLVIAAALVRLSVRATTPAERDP